MYIFVEKWQQYFPTLSIEYATSHSGIAWLKTKNLQRYRTGMKTVYFTNILSVWRRDW